MLSKITKRLPEILTLLILCLQVVLLVLLTIKIGNLERIFKQVLDVNATKPEVMYVERIPDERGQITGSQYADITVVMFSDFECPYCAKTSHIIQEILKKHPDRIRFIYRHFPLSGMHSNAFNAAKSSECAAEQGAFWEMHNLLFVNQTALESDDLYRYATEIGLDINQFTNCMNSEYISSNIKQDIADGEKYGVDSTPTFFVNNMRIVGASGLGDVVQKVLNAP